MIGALMNFTTLGLISWAIFGLIVGSIIHLLDPGDVRGGILGSIITGILGAVLGGFLANIFLGITITGFNIQSFLIALGGALILVIVERALFRERGKIKSDTTRRE